MTIKVSNFIYIYPPSVKGNVVYFEWTIDYESKKLPNTIYVDYYDIDISDVPLQVHYSTIIGLLLNKVSSINVDTFIITEDPIQQDVANFWVGYHSLKNVFFVNTSSEDIRKNNVISDSSVAGILYGGGKDSFCTLDVLTKNPKIEKIKLISFVIPDTHVDLKKLEERRDALILSRVKDHYDIETIKIKTNARAYIKGYHLELYFAPLGVLIWMNFFKYITFSYEYCHYSVLTNNKPDFSFERSHKAVIDSINKFYSNTFSKNPVTIFNANQHLTELSSFGYLANTDPSFYKTLVMCESTLDINSKWCGSCTKCAEFVLFCLYYNLKQNEIDIEWFFSSSSWIKKIIPQVEKLEGNCKFISGLTFYMHFDSFMFVLTKLKDRRVSFSNPIANKNFSLLTEKYYNQSISGEDCFYPDVLRQIYPKELVEDTLNILTKFLSASTSPKQKSSGNNLVEYNFAIQPEIDIHNTSVDTSLFLSRLLSKSRKFHFSFYPENGYISSYTLIPKNTASVNDIDVRISQNSCDLLFNKNPIDINDGYEIKLHIPLHPHYVRSSFSLELPYYSNDVISRFTIELTFGNSSDKINLMRGKVSHYEFDLKSKLNSLEGYNKDNLILTISLTALKKLEPWNWGRAVRLIISNFKFYSERAVDFQTSKHLTFEI